MARGFQKEDAMILWYVIKPTGRWAISILRGRFLWDTPYLLFHCHEVISFSKQSNDGIFVMASLLCISSVESVRSHLLHVTTGGVKSGLKIAFCSTAKGKQNLICPRNTAAIHLQIKTGRKWLADNIQTDLGLNSWFHTGFYTHSSMYPTAKLLITSFQLFCQFLLWQIMGGEGIMETDALEIKNE